MGFIETYAEYAIQGSKNVLPSINMAQAILESAWGKSSLTTKYNNLFGIKGSGTAGSVSLPTKEFVGGRYITINDKFRAYNNPSESFADHDKLLGTSRYKNVVKAQDYKSQAYEIQKAGYATDPAYAQKLINIIEQNNLARLDSGFSPNKISDSSDYKSLARLDSGFSPIKISDSSDKLQSSNVNILEKTGLELFIEPFSIVLLVLIIIILFILLFTTPDKIISTATSGATNLIKEVIPK
jgi:hypothetical protein